MLLETNCLIIIIRSLQIQRFKQVDRKARAKLKHYFTIQKSFVPMFWKLVNIANKYQGWRKKERSVGSVGGNGMPISFRP